MPFQPYNPGDSLETNAVSRIMNPILRAAQTERDAEEQRARMFLAQRQQEQSERAAAANEHRVAIEDARAAQSDRVARANALVEAQRLAQTNPHAAAEYLRAWGHQVDLAPIYEDGPEQAPGTAQAPRPAPQGGSPVPDGAEFGQAPQTAPQGPPGMPGMGPMDGGAMGPHQGRQPQANSPPIAGLPTAEGNLSPADIEAGRQTAMAIPSEAQATPAQRKILGYRLSAGGQTLFDPLEARQQAQALREEQARQGAGMFGDPALDQMYTRAVVAGVPKEKAFADVAAIAKEGRVQGAKNEHDKNYELTARQKYAIGMKPSAGVSAGDGQSIDMRTLVDSKGNYAGLAPGDAKHSPEGQKGREAYAVLSPIRQTLADLRTKIDGTDNWDRVPIVGQFTPTQKRIASTIGTLNAPISQILGSGTPQEKEAQRMIEAMSVAPTTDKATALANIDTLEKYIVEQYDARVHAMTLGQHPLVKAAQAGKERDAKGIRALQTGGKGDRMDEMLEMLK